METRKGTVEFIKKAFHSLPQSVFIKDTECRYVFVTHIWEALAPDAGDTIEGKTDLEVQCDQAYARQCYEEDLEILRTGEQIHKCRTVGSGDEVTYLEITKGPIHNEEGEIIGICGVSNDVTELMKLRKKFEQLSLYDSLTHAYSRHYTARYDFNAPGVMPCSYIMCDCNDLKEVNDRMGHVKGDWYIRYAAAVIRRAMEPQSVLIRWGGDEFLIITPNCSEETHADIIERIEREQERMSECFPNGGVAVGGMLRTSAAVSEQDILQMVDCNMYQDKRRKKAQRPDVSDT